MLASNYGIPFPDDPPPKPEPEHQKRITREKVFEVLTVIALILAGTAFLAFREYQDRHRPDPVQSIPEAIAAIETAGCVPDGNEKLLNTQFNSFRKDIDGFTCHVDLVGTVPSGPLETLVVWLTPVPGQPPSPETMQKAVNSVGVLAQTLLRSATDAFEKASDTMELVGDAKRPHDKGVAGTTDGWKLTYVTYRSFDETVAPVPMLCLILQRLASASNDDQSGFNRTLYEAVNQGSDIKTALRAAESTQKKP